MWSESATFITSTVSQVSLEDEGGVRRKRRATEGRDIGLSTSLNIQLPDEPIEVSPEAGDDIIYHVLNLTADGSAIMIKLMPFNESVIYRLYLSFDDFPNATHYDEYGHLPQNRGFEKVFYSQTNKNGTYRLAIEQCKCESR